MQEKKIDSVLLTQFSGTYIQHVLHEEFLELIEGMPTLNKKLVSKNKSTEITDITTDFVMVGCEFNHAGYITKAITIADFCWGLKEVAFGIGDMAYELFLEIYHEPKKAIVNLATGIPLGLYSAGRMLVNVVKDIGLLGQITITDFFDETRSKELCDDFTGRMMAFDAKVKDTLSLLSSLGIRDAARIGSRAYIDTLLFRKAGSALYKFSSLAKNQGLGYAKRVGKVIKKFTEQEQVALAAEGFVFPIVEQAYEYMDDAQKIGKKAAQITKSAGQKVVNVSIETIKPFFHVVLSEAELASLRQKFKSCIRYKDVVLDFCYEHVFNGEIGKNDKIGGLHHDYQGYLQKSGILKLRKIREFSNGYYEAEIWNARKALWVKKSFFPDHYTREDVMQRIVEAMGSPQVTRIEGAREIIKGLSSDSMVIRIVTQAAETISAYPDFKELL